MANKKFQLKTWIERGETKLTKVHRIDKPKKPKNIKAGGMSGLSHTDSGGDGGGMGEQQEHPKKPTLSEFLSGILPFTFSANVNSATAINKNRTPDDTDEEEQEQQQPRTGGTPKIDLARSLFNSLISRPDVSRADIIDAFIDQIGVTQSTAVSYYERLAKEAGLTGQEREGDAGMVAGAGAGAEPTTPRQVQPQPEPELEVEPDEEGFEIEGDPDKQGTIRTIKGAHLVYKRRNDEGSFDELWVYNTTNDMRDELRIRRDILAATDIPQNRTRSEDGTQQYTLTTLGNGQMLNIMGLPN